MSDCVKKNPKNLAWIVWSCGGLFYFYQFILRTSPSVMAAELMRDFSVSAGAFGGLSACYYYAYSVLQIPLGVMLDRIGPKLILRVTALMCSLGTLIFAFSTHLWVASLGRLLIGAGAAGAFLGTVRLGALWFPPSQLALSVGLTVSLGKLGAMSANLPLTFLVENFNWRTAMMILGVVGFLISALIWLFVSDRPVDSLGLNVPPSPSQEGMATAGAWSSLGLIMKQPAIWGTAAYGCLMYVPLSVFVDVWGIPFLMKAHDISKATASGMVTLLLIGTFFGAPLVALFSDFLCKRKLPMMLSALASLVVNSTLIFIPDLSLTMSSVLLFFVGFSLSGQTLVFAVASERVPVQMGGAVTGFVNMIIMFGGVVLQPLVGVLLDWAWGGMIEDGVPVYTLMDYRFALSTIPLCMVVALVLVVCLIPETHPHPARSQNT